MDRFGQIGPEKGNFDEDLRELAERLERGETVYLKYADRMTRYLLLIVRADAAIAPGGLSGGLGRDKSEWFFVAAEEQGAYWFRFVDQPQPGYVRTKLGLQAPGDGEVVADLFARLAEIL